MILICTAATCQYEKEHPVVINKFIVLSSVKHITYHNIKSENNPITAAANYNSINSVNQGIRLSSPWMSDFELKMKITDLPPSYNSATTNQNVPSPPPYELAIAIPKV